jgi:peptidyl-dipeptidase Dcp
VIPDSLVAKINNSLKFNQGFMTAELCAASILDMKWHELTADTDWENLDIAAFEDNVCRDMGLIDEIIPRYRSTYFNHIFNSGYSAGYYSYLWAEVLDKDAFEYWLSNGLDNPEMALKFRRTFLERGGSEDPMTLYRQFRGADPDPEALVRARGLE